MIRITTEPLNTQAILTAVNNTRAGAVVLFLGTVRELTGERRTLALDYECYPTMAEKQLADVERRARERWPILECVIEHRLGRLELGEASVAVAVSSPHRGDAFAAGQWIIDTLKIEVPIWKREHWADGTTEWVHPGLDQPAPAEAP